LTFWFIVLSDTLEKGKGNEIPKGLLLRKSSPRQHGDATHGIIASITLFLPRGSFPR